MTTAPLDRSDLNSRLVDFHVRLTHPDRLSHCDRLDALIGLRQALRDLCVVEGAWDDLERAHQADLAALRKLAHPASSARLSVGQEAAAA